MKKILAVTLAAMMCLCTVSLAEGNTQATEAPAAAEATLVPTTDLGQVEVTYDESPITLETGASIILPATWTVTELTEEMTAAGTLYAADDPDDETAMTLSYAATEATDTQALAALLAETNTNVSVVTINGLELVSYEAADASSVSFAMLDAQGGAYTMTFAPIPTGADFNTTAATVLSTMTFPAATDASAEPTAEATAEATATAAN
jgi:hypothetical protein